MATTLPSVLSRPPRRRSIPVWRRPSCYSCGAVDRPMTVGWDRDGSVVDAACEKCRPWRVVAGETTEVPSQARDVFYRDFEGRLYGHE